VETSDERNCLGEVEDARERDTRDRGDYALVRFIF
jgi:hypothetical protein